MKNTRSSPTGTNSVPVHSVQPATRKRLTTQMLWAGLFSGIIILGLVAIASITVVTTRHATLSDEMDNLGQISLMLAEQTNRIIFGADLLTSSLEEEVANAGIGSPGELRQYVVSKAMHNRLKEMTIISADVDAFGFINANGKLLNNSREWPPTNVDVSNRSYFTILRDNSGVTSTISAPIMSRATGQGIIILARRLNAPDGTFLGVVAAVMSSNRFERLFADVLRGDHVQASLFHQNGNVLGQQPRIKSFLEQNPTAWEYALDALSWVDELTLSSKDIISQDPAQLMALHNVRGYPLFISVTKDETTVLSKWWKLSATIIISTMIAVILVGMMGRSFARQSKQSEERYRQLFNNANDSIFICDAETLRFTDVNDVAARRLGYSREELIGMCETDINPSKNRDKLEDVIKDLREKGSHVFETKHRRKDGSLLSVEVSSRIINLGDHMVLQNFVRDITMRKQTQAQLIQSSKLATLGEMATGTAHEINQPLNIIRMAAETLTELLAAGDVLTADFLKSKLERISSQVERATNIIDRMRTFGRKPGEHATKISAKDVVLRATGHLREQLRLGGAELQLHIPDACRPIMGDPIQLEQVILNLISNARDAIENKMDTEKEGKVNERIAVNLIDDPSTSAIKIVVKDTGGGIPEEVLPKVFDPFFTTKEVGKGTGVGLSISYGIITEMGGTITAANTDGGAEFTVTLQAADENLDKAET